MRVIGWKRERKMAKNLTYYENTFIHKKNAFPCLTLKAKRMFWIQTSFKWNKLKLDILHHLHNLPSHQTCFLNITWMNKNEHETLLHVICVYRTSWCFNIIHYISEKERKCCLACLSEPSYYSFYSLHFVCDFGAFFDLWMTWTVFLTESFEFRMLKVAEHDLRYQSP
jgi:hypothetical protein